MRKSLDGYVPKTPKVSKYRPTVPNKTILTTKQEFFFTKVAPVQSITDIALLSFWLILLLLNIYFILHYNVFFRKLFFFECSYFSEYDIRMSFFVFWLRGRLFTKYLRNWGNKGVIQNVCRCVQVERGIPPHVYVRTCTIFSYFCLMVSCLFFVEI